MSRLRIAISTALSAFLLAASCARNTTKTAAGELDVNAFTSSRTVLVHVQNSYPTRVRVFTIIGDKSNEITNLVTDGQQTVMLDSRLFPGTSFSLDIRPETGPSKRLGPFHLSRGQTASLIITPNLDSSRVEVHPTTP